MTKPTTSNSSVKLCDSCRTCSSAKVRCTKEKPSCSRCVTRGIECVYRTSKRSGRPSAQSNADGKQREHKRRKPSAEPRVDSVMADDNCESSISSMLEEAPPNIPTTISTYQLDSGMARVSTQPSPNFLDKFTTSLHSDHDIDDFMNYKDSDSTWNYLRNNSDEQRCPHESGCLNFALELLGQSSLVDASTASTRPTGAGKEAPPFTLEAATSLNKELIGPLASILKCSCAPNENLLTILALVISRVLTWCTRAVDNTVPVPTHRESASSDSGGVFFPMDLLDCPQTTLRTSASSGHSEVDAHSVAAAETMLDDLYRLNDIIERFSSHAQVVTGGASAMNRPDETKQSDSIHRSSSSDSLLLSDTMASGVHDEFRRRLHAISLKVVQILLRG